MKKTNKTKSVALSMLALTTAVSAIGLAAYGISKTNSISNSQESSTTVYAADDSYSQGFWSQTDAYQGSGTYAQSGENLNQDSGLTNVEGDGYYYLTSAEMLGFNVDFVLHQGLYLPASHTLPAGTTQAGTTWLNDQDSLAYIPDENVAVLNVVIMDGETSTTGSVANPDNEDLSVFQGADNNNLEDTEDFGGSAIGTADSTRMGYEFYYAPVEPDGSYDSLDKTTSNDKMLMWYIHPEYNKITLSIPIVASGEYVVGIEKIGTAGETEASAETIIEIPQYVDYDNSTATASDLTSLGMSTMYSSQNSTRNSGTELLLEDKTILHGDANKIIEDNKSLIEERIQYSGYTEVVENNNNINGGDSGERYILDAGNIEYSATETADGFWWNWTTVQTPSGTYENAISTNKVYKDTDTVTPGMQPGYTLFDYEEFNEKGWSSTALDFTSTLDVNNATELNENYDLYSKLTIRYFYNIYDSTQNPDDTTSFDMVGVSSYYDIFQTADSGITPSESYSEYYMLTEQEYAQQYQEGEEFVNATATYEEDTSDLKMVFEIHWDYIAAGANIKVNDFLISAEISYATETLYNDVPVANEVVTIDITTTDLVNYYFQNGRYVVATFEKTVNMDTLVGENVTDIVAIDFTVTQDGEQFVAKAATSGRVVNSSNETIDYIEMSIAGSSEFYTDTTAKVSGNFDETTGMLILNTYLYIDVSNPNLHAETFAVNATYTYTDAAGASQTKTTQLSLRAVGPSVVGAPESSAPYIITAQYSAAIDLGVGSTLDKIYLEYSYEGETQYLPTEFLADRSNFDELGVELGYTDVQPVYGLPAWEVGLITLSIVAGVAILAYLGYYAYSEHKKDVKLQKEVHNLEYQIHKLKALEELDEKVDHEISDFKKDASKVKDSKQKEILKQKIEKMESMQKERNQISKQIEELKKKEELLDHQIEDVIHKSKQITTKTSEVKTKK